MSEDKPDGEPPPQARTKSSEKTVMSGDGNAAGRRPGEYFMGRGELSGAHPRPKRPSVQDLANMPAAPGAQPNRNEGSGLLNINDLAAAQPPFAPSDPTRVLPGVTPPASVAGGTNGVAQGTNGLAQGTAPAGPIATPSPNVTVSGHTPARPRRSSEAPSVQRSSAWDAHADRNAPTGVMPAPQPIEDISKPGPGARIQQYELIKMIGEGGMGTVYLARDLRLGRRVAIKFLQSNQPELTQRFLVEARATARCQHDNIVVVYEVGEHSNAPYMVLEFLNGKPLTDILAEGQRLPYTRAVEIMMQVGKALECAHGQGIVHRDLEPDNIFITESGTIKVLDFGIAKVLEERRSPDAVQMSSGAIRMPSPLELATGSNTALTRSGTIMGTLKYMSPEQWGIGIEIDRLSDIWACGVLLHRMICGRHPLHPLDGNQLVVTAMLELPMPSMSEAAPPGTPRELIQIVDRCLLKLKEQRWQSATELMKAIEPFMPGRRAIELQLDESPYAGLSSFQETDAGKFFGRNREIAAMVTRIRDQPLMAVVGSSGVGKSS